MTHSALFFTNLKLAAVSPQLLAIFHHHLDGFVMAIKISGVADFIRFFYIYLKLDLSRYCEIYLIKGLLRSYFEI